MRRMIQIFLFCITFFLIGCGQEKSQLNTMPQYQNQTVPDAPPPPPNIMASFDYKTYSKPKAEQVKFIDRSEGHHEKIQSWQWDFGDGNTSTKQNPVHRYKSIDFYKVRLRITGDQGHESRAAQFIHVGDPKKPGQMVGSLEEGRSFFSHFDKGFIHDGGLVAARLIGSEGTDADLYLQRKNDTGVWVDMASSTSITSDESIRLTMPEGIYRWEVYCFSGKGHFNLPYIDKKFAP